MTVLGVSDVGRPTGGPQGHRLLADGWAGRRGPRAGAVQSVGRGASRRGDRAPAADRARDAVRRRPGVEGLSRALRRPEGNVMPRDGQSDGTPDPTPNRWAGAWRPSVP